MPHFRIVLAYDGTDYVGWQRQANGVSIQGLIEDALGALDGQAVAVAGAGRTDSGVHALGQVAAFTIARAIEPEALVRALNAHLPHAIRVLSAEEVPASFHPRFDAHSKAYRYRIWNSDVLSPFERRYAWHVPGPLDLEAMVAAARLIEGKHDFAAFQATGSDVVTTERDVSSSLVLRPAHHERNLLSLVLSPELVEGSKDEPLIVYEVAGSGFLRHMVRTIAGTLVEIGRGRRPVEWMAEVLASRDRGQAGPTSPPAGLFLVRVDYGPVAAKS